MDALYRIQCVQRSLKGSAIAKDSTLQAILAKRDTAQEGCIYVYISTLIYIYTYLYEAFKIRLSKSTSSVPPQTLEPYEIYYIIYPSRHFQTSRYINSIQFQQIGVCHSGQDTSPSPTCFAIHNDHTWHSSLARLVPAMEETNRTNT